MGDKTGDEGVRRLQERVALSVQRAMEKQKQSMEMMSNIMKAIHDMQMRVINNMRG